MIVSIGAFVQGFMRLEAPAQAMETSGWLYRNFGDQGIAYGMMALGILAFIPGLVWFNQSWIRAIRMRFHKKQT